MNLHLLNVTAPIAISLAGARLRAGDGARKGVFHSISATGGAKTNLGLCE